MRKNGVGIWGGGMEETRTQNIRETYERWRTEERLRERMERGKRKEKEEVEEQRRRQGEDGWRGMDGRKDHREQHHGNKWAAERCCCGVSVSRRVTHLCKQDTDGKKGVKVPPAPSSHLLSHRLTLSSLLPSFHSPLPYPEMIAKEDR